ncbi:MAG TPA: hypothetical protein VLK33_21415, partial [Terriglobales bacterium]|nr:hypothetical protein [Terriglobales bacterium]
GNGFPKTFDFAGMSISNAVRLESACKTGEVLIDSKAWSELPADIQNSYGAEEIVKGKRDEQIRAHRRRVVAPAAWDAEEPTGPLTRKGPLTIKRCLVACAVIGTVLLGIWGPDIPGFSGTRIKEPLVGVAEQIPKVSIISKNVRIGYNEGRKGILFDANIFVETIKGPPKNVSIKMYRNGDELFDEMLLLDGEETDDGKWKLSATDGIDAKTGETVTWRLFCTNEGKRFEFGPFSDTVQ